MPTVLSYSQPTAPCRGWRQPARRALNNQLSTAQYIRRELNAKQLDQPLPANSGIVNANIETLISEYNNLVLDRNRLIANSSEKNPLVKNMANSLQSMQRTIIQSVDNLIVSLNTQIRSIRLQEEATTNRLASNPNQAKYLLPRGAVIRRVL